jgi:hypothetical protein
MFRQADRRDRRELVAVRVGVGLHDLAHQVSDFRWVVVLADRGQVVDVAHQCLIALAN